MSELGMFLFFVGMLGLVYYMIKPFYNTQKILGYYDKLRIGYKIHQYHEGLTAKGIKPEDIKKLIEDILNESDKRKSDFERDTLKD